MSSIFQKPPFNYQYKVGILNAVDFDNATRTATGIASDVDLSSVVLPSGAWVQDGQRIFLTASGRSTGAGNKTIDLRLNTNLLFQLTVAPTNNTGWFLETEILRRANNALKSTSRFYFNLNESAGMAVPSIQMNNTVNNNFSDIVNTEFTFLLRVDVAVGAETFTQHEMNLAIL